MNNGRCGFRVSNFWVRARWLLLHTGELNMKKNLFLNTFGEFINVGNLQQSILHWLGALVLALSLVSCATSQELVFHSFGFNAMWDSPEIEVLYYQYGNSKQPTARTPEWTIAENKMPQRTSMGGEILKGDFLIVKWRIRSTGETFEDTVDLRSRLPSNIKNHQIYFIAKGPQLYVYLITPERRTPEEPPNGPRPYQHLRTITIYPDQPK